MSVDCASLLQVTVRSSAGLGLLLRVRVWATPIYMYSSKRNRLVSLKIYDTKEEYTFFFAGASYSCSLPNSRTLSQIKRKLSISALTSLSIADSIASSPAPFGAEECCATTCPSSPLRRLGAAGLPAAGAAAAAASAGAWLGAWQADDVRPTDGATRWPESLPGKLLLYIVMKWCASSRKVTGGVADEKKPRKVWK